jgi:uncharacterized membrane protein YphA (DoxX/SURF4 family)
MYSVFPHLLPLADLTPFLLRILLGIIFLEWSYRKFKNKASTKNTTIAISEGTIGIFFFIGFLTQLAALIAVALLGTKLISKIRAKAFLTDGVNYYLILFIISLCLLFSGAGFMAFDLPL